MPDRTPPRAQGRPAALGTVGTIDIIAALVTLAGVGCRSAPSRGTPHPAEHPAGPAPAARPPGAPAVLAGVRRPRVTTPASPGAGWRRRIR
jgi:hypothetical protein